MIMPMLTPMFPVVNRTERTLPELSVQSSGGVVEGVAPDAQLFIMKVFGDSSGGAYDDDILAALDDSVKFGVDAINMSLGSTAGFSESAYKSMREVYNRVKNSGIALYCAAGNEYSSTYENAAWKRFVESDRTR